MKTLSKQLHLILVSLLLGAAAFLVVSCDSSSNDIYGSYYGSDGGASYNNSSYYDPWYGGGYYGMGYGYGYGYGGGAVIVAPPASRPNRPHVSPR